MPTLDLGDALLEPTFLDVFTIHRRMEIVDQNGITRRLVQKLTAFGIITVGSGNDMDREPGYSYDKKALTIITRFRLRSVTDVIGPNVTYQPDIIPWRGDHYIVKSLEDWSAYGMGWTSADCVSIDLAQVPPYEFVSQLPAPVIYLTNDEGDAVTDDSGNILTAPDAVLAPPNFAPTQSLSDDEGDQVTNDTDNPLTAQ